LTARPPSDINFFLAGLFFLDSLLNAMGVFAVEKIDREIEIDDFLASKSHNPARIATSLIKVSSCGCCRARAK
jgi:hypothetical protein